jgi:ABC-2 type transport system permease protein
VTIALLAPLAILLATGLTMGLVHGATVHDVAGEAPRVVVASLVQAPALWVLVGVTAVAVGWAPRYASAIGWGAFLFVNVFGSVLSTGMGVEFERLGRLDPFRHLPNVFGPSPDYGPVAVLLLVAAGLVGLGVAGARRRDVG